MLDMRPVEKRRQIPQQSQPPNRSPADIFEQAVVSSSVRRDHHLSAGEAAIVERQEKATPTVVLHLRIHAMWKRPPVQPGQAGKHTENVTSLAKFLEPPVGGSSNIC